MENKAENNGLKFYWTLFINTFYISAFTVGGGYVIAGILQKTFVEKLKLIDEEEMLELIAIAQSAPGLLALNTSAVIGYKLKGLRGAFVTLLGAVLPPFVIIILVSYFYHAIKDNEVVQVALSFMQVGIGIVILDVVVGMFQKAMKSEKAFKIPVFIAALLASMVFNVNVGFIVLASGTLGFLYTYYRGKAGKKA